ncbi:hypothetical protein EHYA_00956 [Embleya hyalina]|uniref:Uncharacterized protein n=1 Tax=Embleya hyalina TaxID=516124 RepID=A0A401YFF0_9ACTN|nr:hypothetical protein EHYA_00956 [Embleya hyalina]
MAQENDPPRKSRPPRKDWKNSFEHWDATPHDWHAEGPDLFQCGECGFRSSVVPVRPTR